MKEKRDSIEECAVAGRGGRVKKRGERRRSRAVREIKGEKRHERREREP